MVPELTTRESEHCWVSLLILSYGIAVLKIKTTPNIQNKLNWRFFGIQSFILGYVTGYVYKFGDTLCHVSGLD